MAQIQYEKEFSAKVPLDEYEKFRKNFPQYGATNWIINSALKEINRLCDEDAPVKKIINRAIARMLQENREARSQS